MNSITINRDTFILSAVKQNIHHEIKFGQVDTRLISDALQKVAVMWNPISFTDCGHTVTVECTDGIEYKIFDTNRVVVTSVRHGYGENHGDVQWKIAKKLCGIVDAIKLRDEQNAYIARFAN